MSVRKDLERDLYAFLDDMDPSGRNTKRMKGFLSKMSDKAFYQYMAEFLQNDDKYIQVGYDPYDNPVDINFVNRVAKKHGIPLYEYVYKPYINFDDSDPPATVNPILVVDIPIKRLKQTIMAKNHTSITNAKRDPKTNQVTGSDKTARVTDAEAFSLIAQELYLVAQEEFGPMADDESAFNDMLRQIQQTGEYSMREAPNDPLNKTTMNTIFMYAMASGISTNLLEESGYILPGTLKAKEIRTTEIKR